MCGEQGEEERSGETIRAIGGNRALVIFARFPDAEQVDSNGNAIDECSGCGDGWAVGTYSGHPPDWANSLLSPSLADTVPGSLTHYFWQMSNGQHVLTGDVLDTVITTDATLTWYYDTYGGSYSTLYGVNEDILDKVDQLSGDWNVDFTQYDGNTDGIVDYIFIYYQSLRNYDEGTHTFRELGAGATAVSALLTGDVHDEGRFDDMTIRAQSGATCWQTTAKVQQELVDVRHLWQVATIFAHEYGHDLTALGGLTGGHYPSMSCYGLMQGWVAPAAMLMSGRARYGLGWLDHDGGGPVEIAFPETFPYDTTLTLSAHYPDGKACFAIVRTAADTEGKEQYFMLEARHDSLPGEYYNAPQPVGGTCCLPTLKVGRGLLITHVRENGMAGWSPVLPKPPTIGIEVATGKFDASTGAPDPEQGWDLISYDSYLSYASPGSSLGNRTGKMSDPYYPGNSNSFGPFTNPSSDLYLDAGYPNVLPQETYSGITIHDIAWNAQEDSIRLSIHIEDPDGAPDGADTLRVDSTWDGTVQLAGDLVVAEETELTIKEGSWIVAKARADFNKDGEDTNRVEIRVDGRVDVQGTDSTAVRFTSSRDDLFTHYFLSAPGSLVVVGETTDPDSGDWWGLRTVDTDPEAELSSIAYGDFWYPDMAVSIDSLSGDLFNCRFTESASGDIHVERDVRIPYGSEWSLLAPTTVVVDSCDAGHRGLDTERNEIDVYGALRTARPAGGGSEDSVVFRSTGETPERGDWYGIIFDFCDLGSKGELRNAKVGYCVTPVTFVAPDSATVQDCIFHDYEEAGVQLLYTDGFTHPSVSGSVFDGSRGVAVDSLGANVGIDAYLSSPRLEDNTVLWHRDHGIQVKYFKDWCGLPPASVDSVVMDNNDILGNGEDSGVYYHGSGLELLWACEERPTRLSHNEIRYWPEGGLELTACADVRVHCNAIEESWRGLQYSRGSQWSSKKILLRQNLLTASTEANLWADDFDYIKLYQSHTGWAKENRFLPDSIAGAPQPRPNIYSAAWGTLNARHSLWMDGFGNVLPESDSLYVRSLIDGRDSTAVNIANFEGDFLYCTPGSSALQERDETPADTERAASTGAPGPSDAIPDRWAVTVSRGPGHALIRLAVPAGAEGPIRAVIYDVRGRRVAVPFDRGAAVPGWYESRWPHVDSSGRRVASGVYFLRLEAPDVALCRKVVVVQ